MSPYVPRIRRHLSIAAVLLGIAAIYAAPAAASTSQVAVFQADGQVLSNPTGTLQTLRDLGVGMVRVNVTWNAIAPSALSTKRPKRLRRHQPGGLSVRRMGAVRRGRPRRRGRPHRARLHAQRPRAAVGDGLRSAKGNDRLLPGGLGAVGEGVRILRQGRRHPLQRVLQARGHVHGAAARELLVDLERAELRLRHRPAGNREEPIDPEQPSHLPKPRGRGLELAERHGPHHPKGQDSVRRDDATRRQPVGRVLEHEAADLPALAVLRRLELPRATRLDGEGPGLPDDGGRARGASASTTRRCSAPAGSPTIPTRRRRRRTGRPTCAETSCAPGPPATPISPICPRSRGSSKRSIT